MDIIVTGRRAQISDQFRDHVGKRLSELDKVADRLIRAEVQITVNEKSRQPDQQVRAEITLIGRGPVVRAEASADEKTIAFDHAFDRLKSRLRKASDRRRTYRDLRSVSKGGELEELGVTFPPSPTPAPAEPEPPAPVEAPKVRTVAGLEIHGDGPLVVREKNFSSPPLTLAQALDEMELVGHDFFLYVDQETGDPSVVYRRRAYDYGVIHLTVEQPRAADAA